MKRVLLLLAISFAVCPAFAQTVSVRDTVYRTYGFSDPNPVPNPSGHIYPYFKFEQFAQKPVEKQWKEVVLENEYLKVAVMPQIGGKIWSIVDKTTGEELFYDNDVVKFRDISLRGPWTSGGIEFNYGVIGHAPSCSFPVEWTVQTNADGSVSCFIGVLELLTRSSWTVEINLPKDAAYLRTRSFWHNYSGFFQPYYTWANSGVRASDDLELIYPGTYTIGHDGVTSLYPIDGQGRDLSIYANQNFGIDKSFHPGGSHKGFFGAYYRNEEQGVLHYALRDEKLGRKYFSWAQSPQGEIWVGLLTDGRSQYVELQSGRLFNQNLLPSVNTPYKQTLFSPFGTDVWNEYWMPFSKIGGADYVTLDAVVKLNDSSLDIYPLTDISGKLMLTDSRGSVLYCENADLEAAKPYSITVSQSQRPAELTIGDHKIWTSDSQNIDRPQESNPDFDLNSPEGLAIYGEYLYGMRYYVEAEKKVDEALASCPALVKALNLKAMLLYRQMRYEESYEYSDRVLAIDQYDPVANYVGGLSAMALGKVYDAMDRFELTAVTEPLRSASLTRLAQLHFAQGDKYLASEYAKKSLVGNAYNLTAYQILYQCEESENALTAIEKLDPLCHFPAIERMLRGEISQEELAASIKEELTSQVYLEWACFYTEMGLEDKALKLVESCPERNALVETWQAWLSMDMNAVSVINASSVDLVFPFRAESYAPLKWAVDNGGGWKSAYMLAMLQAHLGDSVSALDLLSRHKPSYAPYYAFRAQLNDSESDLRKAIGLDPMEWRYRQTLALKLYAEGNYAGGIKILDRYYASHKSNFHVADTYLKLLIAAKDYHKADKVISEVNILPFEGQSGSHIMWRDIKLHLAAESIDNGKLKRAMRYVEESLEWPERLGVGRPYDEFVSEDLENLFRAVIYHRLGDDSKASSYLALVKDADVAKLYEMVSNPVSGRYPRVMPLLENLDASGDKKLF